MSDIEDDVVATCHCTKEITFRDPLSDSECLALIQTCNADHVKILINETRRIVIFPCDDLRDVTRWLAECNLVENIGIMREINEWSIVGLDDYTITFTPEVS